MLEDAYSVVWDLLSIGTIVISVLLEKKTEGLFFDNYLGCDMKQKDVVFSYQTIFALDSLACCRGNVDFQ